MTPDNDSALTSGLRAPTRLGPHITRIGTYPRRLLLLQVDVANSVTPNSGIHCAWQRIATGKSRFVRFRYREAMLATYPEIRDRIYALARKNALRVDWRETTRNSRLLLLYDARQMVVARARVPLRRMDPDVLAELGYQLEDVFGEGWMN
jgi:hypothetical protein